MTPKILLFDIDGTLIRTGGGGKHAMAHALARQFAVQNPDVEIDFAGRTDLSITHELFALNGIALSDDGVHAFLQAYQDSLESSLREQPGTILPGISALLHELSQRGDIHLGLLTGNIRNGAYIKLATHVIDRFFPFGGFGDHSLQRTGIAAEAMEAARSFVHPAPVDPRKVLVIGDTLHDINCAKHVGAVSLAVATGTVLRDELASAHPDYLMDDLARLSEVMAIIDCL